MHVIWCNGSLYTINVVVFLCIFTMCLFNFFSWKEPWSMSCRGRRQVAKRLSGIWPSCPPPPPGCPAYPPNPSPSPFISYSLSSSSFFSSSSSSFYSSFRRLWRPPGPPSSLAGTCKTGTGMSVYRPDLLLPSGSKMLTCLKFFKSCKIVTVIMKLWISDVCYPYKNRRTNNNLKNLRTKNRTKKNQNKHLRSK